MISNSSNQAFVSRVLFNVLNECAATEWLKAFENHTKTTYRVTRGSKFKGKRILYKTERHCQHKRKESKKPSKCTDKECLKLRDKKTNCPSHLTLKLYSTKSSAVETHPCELILHWDHNHTINSAKALSFRPISEDTKEKFENYFDQGHSPSSALHLHQLNLVVMHEGNEKELEKCRADRSTNPMYKDVYYLFKKWRLKNHGKENGKEMFQKLQEIVDTYNKDNGDEGGRAFLQRYEQNPSEKSESWDNRDTAKPLVLAVCTPLMARAHQMVRQASEMVFCDSTASLDRYNCPTFFMSTSSSAGGIPLGVVITSGECMPTLTESFSYLRSIFPTNAFYGRGIMGPTMFITDDSEAERGALRAVWPNSVQLLCIFHYLQSWWTWLWDRKHGIDKEDRYPIMLLVRKLVYNSNETEMEEKYLALMRQDHPDSYVQRYPLLAQRLENFWQRRKEWAVSYRLNDMTRGNNTNNYAEAGIRIIKEIVFGRVKAYNLIQMFQFVTSTMEMYYMNRLFDIAHSRYRPGLTLRYRELEKLQKTITEVKHIRDSIYIVYETRMLVTWIMSLTWGSARAHDSDVSVCDKYDGNVLHEPFI